jgi:hypothetical protein
MVAVAFAEAGEFETARKCMREESRKKQTGSEQRKKTLRTVSAH